VQEGDDSKDAPDSPKWTTYRTGNLSNFKASLLLLQLHIVYLGLNLLSPCAWWSDLQACAADSLTEAWPVQVSKESAGDARPLGTKQDRLAAAAGSIRSPHPSIGRLLGSCL